MNHTIGRLDIARNDFSTVDRFDSIYKPKHHIAAFGSGNLFSIADQRCNQTRRHHMIEQHPLQESRICSQCLQNIRRHRSKRVIGWRKDSKRSLPLQGFDQPSCLHQLNQRREISSCDRSVHDVSFFAQAVLRRRSERKQSQHQHRDDH